MGRNGELHKALHAFGDVQHGPDIFSSERPPSEAK